MAVIGGRLGVYLLRRFFPQLPDIMSGDVYNERSKLRTLLGDDFLERCRNRTVVDFGCGVGEEALMLAREGARRVIGIDIQPHLLDAADRQARVAGLADRVSFTSKLEEQTEIIVSLDSFEHFEDPAAVLKSMADALEPDGEVLVSFGPTWFHPLGGHLFSVFPWAHLVFSESALCEWRRDLKPDGARRFHEIAGGLNRMTIHRFERLVEKSPLELDFLECVPIRKLRPLANRLTREWTTAIVRARLRHRSGSTAGLTA